MRHEEEHHPASVAAAVSLHPGGDGDEGAAAAPQPYSQDDLWRELRDRNPPHCCPELERVFHRSRRLLSLLDARGPPVAAGGDLLLLKAEARERAAAGDEDGLLLVLMAAIRRAFGFYPRITQVVAALLLVEREGRGHRNGRLLEMRTGEGKTVVVCMAAAFQALRRGIQVDVVTSGDVLARREAQPGSKPHAFYSALGLRVGHNLGGQYYDMLTDKAPNVYKECDVLYGTASSFIGDGLRDFQQGAQVASVRPARCLVVDEVDNMLVDCRNHLIKLSKTSYEQGKLRSVHIKIWQLLNADVLGASKGLYDPALPARLKAQMEAVVGGMGLNRYEREVVDLELEEWVESAIAARFLVQEGRDYVIDTDANGKRKVVIVDVHNTGEMQLRTRWEHGLHTFIEFKHKVGEGRWRGRSTSGPGWLSH